MTHPVVAVDTCPAFCEDHLPSESIITNNCERLERTCGYLTQSSACYVQCSAACIAWASEQGEQDASIDIVGEDDDSSSALTKGDLYADKSSFLSNSSVKLPEVMEDEDEESLSIDDDASSLSSNPVVEDNEQDCDDGDEEEEGEDAQDKEEDNNTDAMEMDNEPTAGTSFLDIVDSLDDAGEDGVNVTESQLLRYRLPLSFAWIRCGGCAKFHSPDCCPTNFSMVKDMEGGDDLSLQQCQDTLLVEMFTQTNYCCCCKTIVKGAPSIFMKHEIDCLQGREKSSFAQYGFRLQDRQASISLPTFRLLNLLPRFAESLVSLLKENVLVFERLPNGDTCINVSDDHVPRALALAESAKAATEEAEEAEADPHDEYEAHQSRVREVESYVLQLLRDPRPVRSGATKSYPWGGYHTFRPFAMGWADLFSVFREDTAFRAGLGGEFKLNKNDKLRRSLQNVLCCLHEDKKLQFIHHETHKVLNRNQLSEIIDDDRVWLEKNKSIVIALPLVEGMLEKQFASDRKIEQSLKHMFLLHLHKMKRMSKGAVVNYFTQVALLNSCPEIRTAYPQCGANDVPPLDYYMHPVFELPTRSIHSLVKAIIEMLQFEGKIELALVTDSPNYFVTR
jgi:hypothetical protein